MDAGHAFMMELLGPATSHEEETGDRSRIWQLVLGAYELYQMAWQTDKDLKIANWKWPVNELAEDEPFNERGRLTPFGILLREAVFQARRYQLGLNLEARPHDKTTP